MKPTRFIKEIAKIDGWTYHPAQNTSKLGARPAYWSHENDEVAFCYYDAPAQYMSSRDAIIPVIEKWLNNEDRISKVEKWATFSGIFADMQPYPHLYSTSELLLASPEKLCETLLRAIVKYETKCSMRSHRAVILNFI